MFWLFLIVGVIFAINILFLTALVIAGWLRERRPPTPGGIERQAEEDREQMAALARLAMARKAKEG
jgi:hypothetical protein